MSLRAGSVPHFLRPWSRVARRIRRTPHVALFLDFDGTLVQLAPRPREARLNVATRRVLGRLARNPRVSVAIISGRRRNDLQTRIGLPGVRYLGLFGREAGPMIVLRPSTKKALHKAQELLSRRLASYRGVWLEDKHVSLTLHHANASSAARRAIKRELTATLRTLGLRLQAFENLRDTELLPVDIGDKGTAVRGELSRPALRKALPVYIGDDLSDERAFAALRRGITIRVNPNGHTRAHFMLRNPAEVLTALKKIEATLR